MKLTVGRKLILVFASIIIIILGLSVVNMMNMNSIKSESAKVSKHQLPSVIYASEMRHIMNSLVTQELYYVNSTNESNRKEYALTMEALLSRHKAVTKKYEALLSNEEEKTLYDDVKKEWDDYLAMHEEMMAEGQANNVEKAEEILRKASWSLSSININMNKLVELSEKSANKASEEIDERYTKSTILSLVFIVIAISLAVVLGNILSRNISIPIRKMAAQARQVAGGNLVDEEIMIRNKDEIGQLAKDFNEMTKSLRTVITTVSGHSEQVATTSKQLTASAEQSAKASEQITFSIQEVASGSESQMHQAIEANNAVEEISKGMNQAASSIQVVADISTEATERAAAGDIVVRDTVSQMNAVQAQVRQTAKVVNSLGEKSAHIRKIVALITEVADQTNLLALNAAIEAARAGEHGRGFAVVADEVRKLAEQSSHAAEEISQIIIEIGNEATNAVEAMQAGSEAVNGGIVKVEETGNAFKEIAKKIEEVALHTQDVSAVVQQVSASSDSMVLLINGVATLSEQAAGNTQNVAAASEEQNASMDEITKSALDLSHMANELQSIVSKFNVSSKEENSRQQERKIQKTKKKLKLFYK